MMKTYLTDGRLEDVIALIQFLGLGEHTHRYSGTIADELGQPKSAKTWAKIGHDHPEFFRAVKGKEDLSLSLLSRHLKPKRHDDKTDPLGPEEILTLVKAAIATHATQVQRRQIGKVGFWVLLFSGIITVLASGVPELVKFILQKYGGQ